MWYYVTEKDIKVGEPGSPDRCPVARSIRRKHPRLAKLDAIKVTSSFTAVWNRHGNCVRHRNPMSVFNFIKEFDRFDGKVIRGPFRFWLNIYAKSSRIV